MIMLQQIIISGREERTTMEMTNRNGQVTHSHIAEFSKQNRANIELWYCETVYENFFAVSSLKGIREKSRKGP